jgi:hypothetical protein
MARSRRKEAQPVLKVKKTLSLDVQTARRLAAYAGARGCDESQVVAEGIDLVTRGFRFTAVSVQGATTTTVQSDPEPLRDGPGPLPRLAV